MIPGGVTIRTLVDYFLEACKPRDEWRVGIEVEKMGRDRETSRPIPYEGAPASVRAVLETYLGIRGGEPIYEGDHLVGVAGPWGTLSLEPGGQVEWSSRPCPDLLSIAEELCAHLEALAASGRSTGIAWLSVAVEPEYAVEEMPWVPKARYKIMSDYLGARGRLAHRMMTQTASIQCAFDFESPDDWSRKFRAAVFLCPVSVALFANSRRADGNETGYCSFRQRIWRETDPDRCGIPSGAFDAGFGIEEWVDWVARVPVIFQRRARGLVRGGGARFADLLQHRECTAISIEDWELHLSTIFTDVRSYGYIEVRSADLLRDDRILSVPTFWTGILYHPDGLLFALERASTLGNAETWLEAMEAASRQGLDATVGKRPIRALAEEALRMSAWGLRNGAACAGTGSDPAEPLSRLARSLGLDPTGTVR